jgi:rubrerythrin
MSGQHAGSSRPDRPLVEPESEPVCLLARVCPECGRVADREPPTRCAACGSLITAD